ncbi:E1-E2 ATPase-associated domain protein [Emticicia oligotrophica DSM 17448]|uniref:E1-E2 ATPase-associated domain protein n=1 Tax=Emticicia oligotrophica (strain DSM 17448 / CIP 109782 / MTCC 6937 / GPTSA100-15) TaxID=929562 RepID=A0ABN4ADD9_EMTOG|nr:heavy metal translocating P-type ATPase metal-binding domain-containing protein [Emticicia oligotrophica]AFK01527.1 E1-E2 ATPase-associated domain protein [Emticicia oligotrophica DSM 17448]
MKNQLLEVEEKLVCYHCGDECPDDSISIEEKHFCCHGCQTVYEILQDNNLCTYYDLNSNAGISLKAKNFEGKYSFLEDTTIISQLLDYQSENLCKVTFYIPSVHCSSCVWLLENFNKVRAGVFTSRLNFIKKELSLSFNPTEVSLKEVVELLATLGYEPLINLESTEERKDKKNLAQRSLIIKIGVVGFCMGNIMMMSFPEYFHLNLKNNIDATYQKFFLYFNFLLSLPVFFYGSYDYLYGAWVSIKENIKKTTNVFSVDIPIAVAIITLYARSVFETFVNHSAGYYDSLAGLVFFLLVGKWVQQITYNYLSFERNYKSYFPLAVKVSRAGEESFVNVMELRKGDTIFIHHQELIPADALIVKGKGMIDYSFVTGESDAVTKQVGELIYAGGRQKGERLELVVQKPVSQSYLTQLWNNDAFTKEKVMPTTELANLFSKYFTVITFTIATVAGIYWSVFNPSLFWNAITAVLMVACPCALTLSMPFTMSTTMAIFGRNKFYVKNQGVIQLLNEVNEITFDKTGTLTESNSEKVSYVGNLLGDFEVSLVKTITQQSAHPLSKMITESLKISNLKPLQVEYFQEFQGEGIEASISGNLIRIGKAGFIKSANREVAHTHAFVEINGICVGYYIVETIYRKNWQSILTDLKKSFRLFLLSGDNDADKEKLEPYFNENNLFFKQKPQDKLNFIRQEQQKGNHVLMIGDGLNDAGALRQSNVGIAISEDIKVFSPACDAILDASKFGRLAEFLRFSKTSLNIVKASFVLSLVYNFIGISWAVTGELSPVLAAIFMPLSSLSVVLFAVGLTHLFARFRKL